MNAETKVRVCHFSLIHNVFKVKDVITLAGGNSSGEAVWLSKVTGPSSRGRLSQMHFRTGNNGSGGSGVQVVLHVERDEAIKML